MKKKEPTREEMIAVVNEWENKLLDWMIENPPTETKLPLPIDKIGIKDRILRFMKIKLLKKKNES